jgi:hypothetical protein
MDVRDREVWVYSVDTHDTFNRATQTLSAEDAAAWKAITDQNRTLKNCIEQALAQAGYLTPVALLRIDLTPAAVS